MSQNISSKIIGILSVLALVLLSVSFASALTLSTPSKLTANDNSSAFILTNNDAVAVNATLSVSDIISGANRVVLDITPSTANALAAGDSVTAEISIQEIIGNFEFGEYTTTINAESINADTGADVDTATATVTYLQSFCKSGEKGNLDIRDIKIDNLGEGKDDEWQLLDEIQVTVEVKNVGSDDIDDVFIEIGLFDSAGDNVIGDLDFTSVDEEEADIGNINDGKTEEVTFEFVVPADFNDGDYKLVVKAYSDKDGEAAICADTSSDLDGDYFQAITVERESDEGKFISFQNINLSPSPATCGDTLTLMLDVYNIGDEDQDQVKVNVKSSALGIDTSQEIRNDLDQGDKQKLTFTFVVPQVADGSYNLELDSEYDYKNRTYT